MSARNTRRKVSPAHRGLRAGDSGLQRPAAARGKPRPVTGAGGAAEGRRARLSRNVVVSAVISTPQRVSHVKQGWRPAKLPQVGLLRARGVTTATGRLPSYWETSIKV